ncbi:nucleoside hydrolase [Pseudalkalibacillus decolorationis]|uniref:nucleoside hydrolase n=1 Tax=Pseudalkalibacillus decolorationis TaxID=163879 RepID=UPI002147B609|nr:nucleoside hydrolase [Pseudalkalibacillus decolorationis]
MNVLLFTDSGIDDTFALIYALRHPQINLIGVVAGYGNVQRDRTIRNTQYVLSLLGQENIPIISGASRPILGDEPVYYPYVHGVEGFGTIIPQQQPKDLYNFSNVITLLTQSSTPVTIVNIGRLTSLSVAFLLHPEILSLVQNIYIMGGAFLVPGNVTPYAEANFFADPTSASIVFNHSSPLSVRLFPLNVTHKAIFTPDIVQTITQKMEESVGQFLVSTFQYYYTFYQRQRPNLYGAPLHDLVAMNAVVNPHLFSSIQRNVQIIDTSPLGKGISIADFRDRPIIDPSKNDFSFIALDMDYQRFIQDVYLTFSS